MIFASASLVKVRQIISGMSVTQKTAVPAHNNMLKIIAQMLRFIGNMLFILAGLLETDTTAPVSSTSALAEAETPPELDPLTSIDADAEAETLFKSTAWANPDAHADPLIPSKSDPGERSSAPPPAAQEPTSVPPTTAPEHSPVPPPAASETIPERHVFVTTLNGLYGSGKYHNISSCYGLRKAFQLNRTNWINAVTGGQTECSLCRL